MRDGTATKIRIEKIQIKYGYFGNMEKTCEMVQKHSIYPYCSLRIFFSSLLYSWIVFYCVMWKGNGTGQKKISSMV